MKKSSVFSICAGLLATIGLVQCASEQVAPSGVIAATSQADAVTQTSIYPGKEWKDINGNVINAHSAGIYYENGFYHWYGEHKFAGTTEPTGYTEGGIHCYRSRDLINWNDFGVILPVDRTNPNSDIAYGCRFQRPKVVFNSSTGKYVALFKLYLKGQGVATGYTGAATATSPTGPFTYRGKFLGASTAGTGDFALFQTSTGDLYHIAVRKTDRVLVKAKMSADYLTPATAYAACPGVAVSTEGPAVFYKSGTYHLLGSGSTGWDPNAPRYYTASSINGPWTVQANPLHGTNPVNGLNETKTFGGQSTTFLQIQGVENQYIALFDVWKPGDPITSPYIWLPFRVSNQKISINWVNSWNLSWFNTH